MQSSDLLTQARQAGHRFIPLGVLKPAATCAASSSPRPDSTRSSQKPTTPSCPPNSPHSLETRSPSGRRYTTPADVTGAAPGSARHLVARAVAPALVSHRPGRPRLGMPPRPREGRTRAGAGGRRRLPERVGRSRLTGRRRIRVVGRCTDSHEAGQSRRPAARQ